MNEQDNLQTVRHAYKAFVEGDFSTVLSLVIDDVEFLPPVIVSIPWAHPWRGRKEVEQYFRALAEGLEFQEFAGDEFIVGGDSVVVLGHERCIVRTTGRVVQAKWCRFLTFATVSYVDIANIPIPPPGTLGFSQQNKRLSNGVS